MEVSKLLAQPLIETEQKSHRLLYLRDYDKLESCPEYKNLPVDGQKKLVGWSLIAALYDTYLGRLYFNLNFKFSVFLMKYFPFLAFFRFGYNASFVNVFEEDPTCNTELKPNSEYYKAQKRPTPRPWYKKNFIFSLFENLF